MSFDPEAESPNRRAVQVVVVRREEAGPAAPGAPPYEILHGYFHGSLDPGDPANAVITDLELAPRNGDGRVEYRATFALAKPVDMRHASGVLIYDVPNRGVWQVGADRHGHVRVISGWQGDIPASEGLQTIEAPVIEGLTGPALLRLVNMPPGKHCLPLRIEHYFPYPAPTPASLDTRQATLAWRDADDKPPNAVDPDDWAFSDCRSQPFPGTPDPGRVSLRAGFDPARAYELSYIAKDPKVLGVGFAATRDLIAFLRHGPDASNPVGGHIRWVVGFGVSQAGNFLRTFVHLGFNADTAGRPVFDGINPQIAARHVPLNVRFGAPGGAAGLHELGSEGVLWWSRYDDQARGRPPASLLDRANAAGVCPKVIESFGSAEFWGLRMSPALVGAEASEDVPLPANVRRYYFPGVTHGGALASGFDYSKTPDPGGPAALLPANPNPCFETVRILQQALIDWVRTGKEPPPSCYPTLAAGDLVAVEATGWPDIPDAPDPVGKLNAFYDYDVGPSFRYADLSGVPEFLPPRIRRTLRSLVPRVDADGNETAGIASVQLLAPLGTYTGWNVQAQGYGAGGPCGFFGGFIPFAESKAERLAAGDPRLSLEERYGDHGGFVAAVRAAVADRLAHGWLAEDDAARLISKAEASLVLGGA
ncbi:MAG TPA: alpha/beta hydrolase domain-containing protein, partial [Caulobacteraceae bacterium]|nr:alpha/beta hydrolase domain-containing protein [Caulobacteraceae bacterium]